jgi:hypothetical protein
MLRVICIADDSMMIHFPRKRCISISITRAIRMRDREDEKFGSLKYFEVCNIHKKEPWAQWIRFINLIGTIIYLK